MPEVKSAETERYIKPAEVAESGRAELELVDIHLPVVQAEQVPVPRVAHVEDG